MHKSSHAGSICPQAWRVKAAARLGWRLRLDWVGHTSCIHPHCQPRVGTHAAASRRTTPMMDTEIKPRAPIRRFDVFAEYNRLKGLRQGLDEPHARGYGLWVAKVVASGRRGTSQRDHHDGQAADTERQ